MKINDKRKNNIAEANVSNFLFSLLAFEHSITIAIAKKIINMTTPPYIIISDLFFVEFPMIIFLL